MFQVMGIWQDVTCFEGQPIAATDFFWLDCPLKEAKEKLAPFLNRQQKDLLSSILLEKPSKYVRVSRSFCRSVKGLRISMVASRNLEYVEIKPFDWTEWHPDDSNTPQRTFIVSFEQVEETVLVTLQDIREMASRTITHAAWKDNLRLIVTFDNGVTKIVNLATNSSHAKMPDDDSVQSFKISERAASLVWQCGAQFGAQELYNMGIRCRMDFADPVVEWYLSCFDAHLDGATILFANSHTDESDPHQVPLFILYEQHGKWFRVDDIIIDSCDPACGAGWKSFVRETSREKLLREIDQFGLGNYDGQNVFANRLRTFLTIT